jgi:hypothetical protein
MPRHKFQPGNKFGGRKPIPEGVKELARAATPRAIQRQIELMESEDENVALKATNSILDRALGKPAQTVNANLARNNAVDYSLSELLAIAYGRGTDAQTIEGTAEELQPEGRGDKAKDRLER